MHGGLLSAKGVFGVKPISYNSNTFSDFVE